MCDRVGVLYAGRLVEEGPVETILAGSAPSVHRRPAALHPTRRRPQGPRPARHDPGLPAEPRRSDLPGCVFADRCALADDRCRTEEPRARGDRRRSHEPLLPPRAGRRACRARTAADLASARGRPQRDAARRASTTSARCSSSTGTRSTLSSASARRSGPARRSGSSASRAAARRRSPGRCSGSSGRRPAPSSSTGGRSRRGSRSASQDDLRALQIVFQNPDSALNRRHSVRRILMRVDEASWPGMRGAEADAPHGRARRTASASPSAR